MHYGYFNGPSCSHDFSFDFSVWHLRKNFSDPLYGLPDGHIVPPIHPSLDLLNKVAVVLVSSPVVVHIIEGILDSREPIAHI